jgi:OOP family OmpA-OmpF porin
VTAASTWPLTLVAALLLAITGNANALSPQPDIHIILFDSDNANPDRSAIDQIVADVRTNYGSVYAISVTGHADRAGPADYNLALSLARAEAVDYLLILKGIPRDAITIAGRGETEPAVPTADGVSEPANRRVVVIVQ